MKLELRNYNISAKLALGFTFVLVVLISAVLVSFLNSKNLIRSTNLIVQTQSVLTELADIEAKLIDLETGQRGFIITNDYQYLEPYNNSLKIIGDKLDYLRDVTSDNESQQIKIDKLEELISAKLEELNETIELRKNQGFEAAQEIVSSDVGMIIMDNIRILLSEIKMEETELLEARSIAPVDAQIITNIVLIVLLVYGILASIIIGRFTALSVTNPIMALIKSTEIVGQGNLKHKIGINTEDEIGALSKSFETMLQNLRSTMASKEGLEKEILIRKITEKKLLETQRRLEKSESKLIESNKTKDKFLSIIAHDLRGPFNSLLGLSSMLDESYDELNQHDRKQFIQLISRGIEDTYALLENLLVWSTTQGGYISFKPQQESLYVLSKNTVDLLSLSAQSKSINIETKIPANIIVNTDKDMFDTIIRNLLTNAIKFTQEKGEVSLEAKLKNGNGLKEYVEIKVQDNGVGIGEEVRNKLFEIGETISTSGTANETGTGLGLYICHDFVKMHGGKIWVESVVGKGSTFCFSLPNASRLA